MEVGGRMARDKNVSYTGAQLMAARDFLDKQRFPDGSYWKSYESWKHGGNAWYKLESGGTTQMQALQWYQHVHKPGSKEWRPSIIIAAVVAAANAAQPSETGGEG